MNLQDVLSGFLWPDFCFFRSGREFRIHSRDSHRAVVLKLDHASESTRELVRIQISKSQYPELLCQDSKGVEWNPVLHLQISRQCWCYWSGHHTLRTIDFNKWSVKNPHTLSNISNTMDINIFKADIQKVYLPYK